MTSQICCLHHLTPLITIMWKYIHSYKLPSYKPPFIGDSRPAMDDDNSRQSPISKVNPHFWVKGWMVGLICWFSAINEEYWILVSNGQYIFRLINDGWFITWLERFFYQLKFMSCRFHPHFVFDKSCFSCARLPLKLHLRPMSCSNPKCAWKSPCLAQGIAVLSCYIQFWLVQNLVKNQKFHWWTHKLRKDPNVHYLT